MTVAPETITTPRLVLRRPKPSDATAVYEYGRDPEVTRYMDWHTHSDIRDAIAATESALQRWDSGAEYTWRITVKPDDVPIGAIACRVCGHTADLGFVLARPSWSKGYATEAARAVFEWACALEGVYRVWATCDVHNNASARVLEKIGMSREGVLRRWAVRPNLPSQGPRDAFVYGCVRFGGRGLRLATRGGAGCGAGWLPLRVSRRRSDLRAPFYEVAHAGRLPDG